MWTKVAHFILKFRIALIVVLVAITAVLSVFAVRARTTFKFAELVPVTDPGMQQFMEFKATFGQDANILLIGIDDQKLYLKDNFNAYIELLTSIEKIKHDVESDEILQTDDTSKVSVFSSVLDIHKIQYLTPNADERKFDVLYPFKEEIKSQKHLDSLIVLARSLKFYQGLLLENKGNAINAYVSFKEFYVNSKLRQDVVFIIQEKAEKFTEKTGIQIHFAGVPFVRTIMTDQVKAELKLFMLLSLIVTACMLYFFLRSFYAVLFPLLVIGMSVVWVLATIVLLGYEISMLTGLIPPIIIVIGIPNCIYLLTKYHVVYKKSRNKIWSLSAVIRKLGLVTLITNGTTAIGFGVLLGADITILKEFGIVASVNVMSTFLISIILIPAVFSFLPAPNPKELRHLDFKIISRFLLWLDYIVANKRSKIYMVVAAIVVISGFGCFKIYSVSYMVDDIPKDHQVKQDLLFFESNFKGVMPMEIVINTNNKRPYTDLELLAKVDEFQLFLRDLPQVSEPFSILNIIKAVRQSYWNNDPKFYGIPTNQDKNLIYRLLKKSDNSSAALLKSFVDSTGKLRISLKVADIGSNKMEYLVQNVIKPKADEIFQNPNSDVKYDYYITGTTLLFIRGINFLLDNLVDSILLAIGLISIIMGLLFRSLRMILISIIPNLIPLMITGALMGYLGIPLKPSTALIFSIAFGISVDDTIHFLAKYRQELVLNNYSVKKAVSLSIKETGASMIYTSLVLFGGFFIFTQSNFIGTKMLGLLTSTTLICAMLTNLIVLPTLLLAFDNGNKKRNMSMMDSYQADEEETPKD